MATKIKTSPALEPVTLSEAKSYLRITDNNDDAFITTLISAVRRRCEGYTQRALITQTWTLWLDGLLRRDRYAPQDGAQDLPINYDGGLYEAIDLPHPPLQSVTLMNSYAVDNSAALFSISNYIIYTAS